MNKEFEKICEEVVVVYLEVVSHHFLQEPCVSRARRSQDGTRTNEAGSANQTEVA
jgi:hypothetical protein